MVCKKQVGHALSVPDREESHLLSEDLGSGEPVSRASAPQKKGWESKVSVRTCFKFTPEKWYISDKKNMSEK